MSQYVAEGRAGFGSRAEAWPKPALFNHRKGKIMSIELIILIVVLIVLFGGGGGYYYRSRR